jgi:hypothetical protein
MTSAGHAVSTVIFRSFDVEVKMSHIEEITERTQAILARSRAFRERSQAMRDEHRALIERASIKSGQLHFVFSPPGQEGAKH